jgi:group I intron endonuclease
VFGGYFFMRKKISCIYKITSPTGRVYIGQTVNYKDRICRYRIGQFKKQKRLYLSVKKHGIENHSFEILELCKPELLNVRERYYQDLYDVTSKKGLNIRLTETNDKSGYLSESSKLKISKKNKGKGNGMYGKKIKESSKVLQRIKLSGENNYLSKWLINLETGIFYPCLAQAANTINMDKRLLWANITKYKKNKTSFVYA